MNRTAERVGDAGAPGAWSGPPPARTVNLQQRMTLAILIGVGVGSLAAIGLFEAARVFAADAAAAVDAVLFPGAFHAAVAVLASGAAATMVAGPLGLFASRGVKRRLRQLGRLAGALAQGDLGRRARTEPPDEIGELGLAFNRMAARLAELTAERQRLAALEERQRIARDLHDAVAQQLFSLGALAAAARRRLDGLAEAQRATEADVAAEREALLRRAWEDVAQMDALARSCPAEMRALIEQLRPPLLREGTLADALQRLADDSSKRAGLPVRFRARGSIRPTAADADLLRVAQEALANALRHGRPARVEIELDYGPSELRLTVTDDGQGFDPHAPPRPGAAGLAGMRERAEALRGAFRIVAAPGRGTRVEACVPAVEHTEPSLEGGT